MVETKSLVLENKANQNGCKSVYPSLESLLRSVKFLNKSFSISQPVLDLTFVTPDKNMFREYLITY